MGEPFLGEIKIVSFNFPPRGWAFCNGQFLPINQNQALFSLFGTMYGGNGQTTFALPDFRGKVPMHVGAGFIQGQTGGAYSVTVNQSQMPAHTHFVMCTNTDNTATSSFNPNGTILGPGNNLYGPLNSLTTLSPAGVTNIGGSQAHNNMQPYTVLNFIVALQGIFPSRN
jgi:microcystin-dependent protein